MTRTHSYSKRDTLATCALRYFFEYYAGGKVVPFDSRRKERVRVLKALTGCYLLAGDILHDLIRLYFVKGSDWGCNWYVRTASQRFDKAVTYSRDPVANSWMAKEQFPPPHLVEYYYEDERADVIAADAKERLLQAIRNFFGSADVRLLISEMRQGDCVAEKRIGGLRLDNYSIGGKVDLVSTVLPGVRIVDWKMGQPVGDEPSLQLFTYGWWASQTYNVRAEDVKVQRVFLGNGSVEPERTIGLDAMRRGKARLLQDIELMKELEPYGAVGNEKAFSPCGIENVCRPCKYREICPLSSATGASKQTFDLFSLQTAST